MAHIVTASVTTLEPWSGGQEGNVAGLSNLAARKHDSQ